VDSSIGIGDIAAVVTIAGVTIYALGLLGLAIPISTVFTKDMSTAWYAVSLMPRTVVAGQGVRIWIRWPFLLTTLLLLIMWLLLGLGVEGANKPDLSIPRIPGTWLILITGSSAIVSAGAEVFIRVLLQRQPWRAVVISRLLRTIGIVMLQVLLVIMASPEAIPLTYIISGLLIGSFLVGVPPAIEAKPPLPKVEITKQAASTTEENSNPTEVEGHLVTHSDGFWHLFDNHNELLSIPDDLVLEVRTFGRQRLLSAAQRRKIREVMKSDAEKN